MVTGEKILHGPFGIPGRTVANLAYCSNIVKYNSISAAAKLIDCPIRHHGHGMVMVPLHVESSHVIITRETNNRFCFAFWSVKLIDQ